MAAVYMSPTKNKARNNGFSRYCFSPHAHTHTHTHTSDSVSDIYKLLLKGFPVNTYATPKNTVSNEKQLVLTEFRLALSDPSKKERDFWQPFLARNKWLLSFTNFILLADTRIDLNNTADFLYEAEDGFIDIIEIKHPQLHFWHHNSRLLQPSQDVNSAITQGANYLFQLEKKFNDADWQRAHNNKTTIKPNCTILIGRSNDWGIEQKMAYRLLNDKLHAIRLLTFDQLYERAQRLLQVMGDV